MYFNGTRFTDMLAAFLFSSMFSFVHATVYIVEEEAASIAL